MKAIADLSARQVVAGRKPKQYRVQSARVLSKPDGRRALGLLTVILILAIVLLAAPLIVLAADVTYGSASQFSGTDTAGRCTNVASLGEDKIVVGWRDGAANAGIARVGTINGTAISWGDPSTFCSDISAGGNYFEIVALGTDKFIVAYVDDAQGDDGYVRLGTVSGTTITWKDAVEFDDTDAEDVTACYLASNKFAIAYNDETGGNVGTVVVCTVDGSDIITCGTPVSFEGYTRWHRAAPLDTDKFVVTYEDQADSYYKACAFTVSGTTPTAGDILTISTGNVNYYGTDTEQLDTDKFVTMWYGQGATGKVQICTVSGTTITEGAETNIYIGSNVYFYESSLAALDSSHFILALRVSSSGNYGKTLLCSYSGTTITIGDALEDFNAAKSDYVDVCYVSYPKIAISYTDDADASDIGEVIIGEVAGLTLPAPDPPTNVSATDGTYTDRVTITWTKSEGATGYKVYGDGELIDTLGDVASYNHTTAPAPTITPGSTVASDGTSTAHVALNLTGASANQGTSVTYKVVAFNDNGDSGDSDTDAGYRGVGALTYQWQRSAGDSDADYSNIDGATASTYEDTAAPAPTVTAGNATADGSGGNHVTLELENHSANNGEGRYYQCALSATGAAGQTSAADRGYRGPSALSYQWQRSAADSDASYGDIEGATTDPYNDLGGVDYPDGRYYRAVVSMGEISQNSTAARGFLAVAPTVTNSAATNITLDGATLWGNVTSTGGHNSTVQGFMWGLATGNYTVSWNQTGSYGTGAFSHTVTGLDPGTDVYWIAFAINPIGQGNSTELMFTVGQLPAAPTDFTITHGLLDIWEITWGTGLRADTTIVIGNESHYPTSPTDGYVVYSGNGTSYTLAGINADIQTAYFRAYSENTWGYSPDYAEDMIGNPISVAGIIFVVGIAIFALWKRAWVRALLSICLIIFGVAAMPYDMKVAAPLLALGVVLFFVATMRQIILAREGGT